jgi:hypothetical protein
MKIILTILTLIISVAVNSQNLKLEIVGDISTFEIGQEIEFKLSMANLNGGLSYKSNSKDIVIDMKDLEKRFFVICNEIGKHEIGPYEITINNKTIKSNNISIHIVDPVISNQITDTLISLLIPNSIKKGEEFTMTIKSNLQLNNAPTINDIKNLDDLSQLNIAALKISNKLKIKQLNLSYSSSKTIKDGKEVNEFIYTFTMMAKNKGIVNINSTSFDPKLPIIFKGKTIEIK